MIFSTNTSKDEQSGWSPIGADEPKMFYDTNARRSEDRGALDLTQPLREASRWFGSLTVFRPPGNVSLLEAPRFICPAPKAPELKTVASKKAHGIHEAPTRNDRLGTSRPTPTVDTVTSRARDVETSLLCRRILFSPNPGFLDAPTPFEPRLFFLVDCASLISSSSLRTTLEPILPLVKLTVGLVHLFHIAPADRSAKCYAPLRMELSLEAYRNIVNYVGNRSDIATLCRVSKGFQYVAQRALYNTLYLRNVHSTISVCHTLSTSPRLAGLVDALTVSLSDKEQDNDSDSGDGSQSRAGLDEEENAPSITDFWEAIASALRITSRLRYLNIHINSSAASVAWILQGCAFRLRGFHCDLDWDLDLVTFLNTQTDLDDLYILDYQEDTPSTVSSSPSLRLLSTALPNLSTLECTFSEAAVAIVPGRPITHLKSCFSRTVIEEKHAEMSLLFSKIRHSSRRLRALDIADSSYTEPFSMELLRHVIRTKATVSELRYLGTLVLPIGGQERLQFYGLLMRLPRIECVEVEVSHWEPPPATLTAFRALTLELRLYCPTVTRVIFVHEFDRTVTSVVGGLCVLDNEISTDMLWSEI